MSRTEARIPTAHGAKYLSQLCKHWSHKLPVELGDGHGRVAFGAAVATFDADPEALTVRLEAPADDMGRMQEVVVRHLDRFAFREAPLAYDWRAPA
jgi:hypothetical protein